MHNIFWIPPAVILFVIGVVGLVIFERKIAFHKITLLPLFVCCFFLISQPLLGASLVGLSGVIIAIMYFPVMVVYGSRLTTDKLERLSLTFIRFGTFILSLEAIWRLLHPDLRYRQFLRINDTRWIYMFKMNSFMYSDSNIVGIHIIVLMFTLVFLQEVLRKKFYVYQIILFVLLILTFSRAAWIACGIGAVFIFFIRRRDLLSRLVIIISSIVVAMAIYWYYLRPIIMGDFSFRAKYNMLDLILFYISKASFLDLFFGVGFTNSIRELGIYAHNVFLVFFIEAGFIGLIIWIVLQIHLLLATRFSSIILLLPFLTATLSASATFTPYLYTAFSLFYLWHCKRFEIKPDAY